MDTAGRVEEEATVTLKQRVMGMFCAHHMGDALGAPHEFRCNKDTVYTGKLEIQPYRRRDARYFAADNREVIQPIGTVTDDTQMTVALLKTIIKEDGAYDSRSAILAYSAWTHSGAIDMGTNTRFIFANKTVKGYDLRIEKLRQEVASGARQISLANGALMRCTPLALLKDWKGGG